MFKLLFSLQVRLYNFRKLFGVLRSRIRAFRANYMFENVVFHHLTHQPIHSAANRGNEPQHIRAFSLGGKRSLKSFDLAAYTA
jgi:hypothetical protein